MIQLRSRSLRKLSFLFLLPAALAACGDETLPGTGGTGGTGGAPVDNVGADFSAGPFTVEPGTELVMCTYVRAENDEEQDVTLFQTEQSPGGHHLIVYTMDHAVDLAPGLCSQGGQPSWNQLLATQLHKEEQGFPEGVGFHIKARQQFVMETHYINTTGEALVVDSKFAMTYGAPGSVKERAGTYFFGTLNIDVPPNSKFTKTVECTPPVDMSLRTMFGHEHRYGTGVSARLLAGGKDDGDMLYETKEWEAPPILGFDGGRTLSMSDKIRVTCDWDNTGSTNLRYPHEMCFAIGYYWPANGSLLCTSGGGKDECVCRGQGTLDTGPGGAAVDVKLTRTETVSGSLGALDTGAPIYCALFRAEDWGDILPKPGVEPFYFRDAVDFPLKTPNDEVGFLIEDVTPGDYMVTCMMDSIGGGFMPGTGDVINGTPAKVTVAKGKTAKAKVVLDFAIP